jgi:hypothetical protein
MIPWRTRCVGGPAIVVFAGALTSAAGGLWAAVDADHSGGAAIVIFVGVFVTAGGALWGSIQQTQSERLLRLRSDEIAELNRTIAASVTGGDSFCYLALSLGDEAANSPLLAVVHQGNYPLYDVQIRVVDLEKFDLIKDHLTLEAMTQTETVLNMGNLSPNQAAMIGTWQLPNADQQRYNIFIHARNGFVTQMIRLRRVEGRWKSATKVTRGFGEQEAALFERVDAEFPRGEGGEVQWERPQGSGQSSVV